jgi:hypothetical protein
MGLNVWNIDFEAKYIISLEHGKENMSITCKSHASKKFHHQFVVAKFCFSRFHLWTSIHEKTKNPIIQASSDLWSFQDSEPWHSRG